MFASWLHGPACECPALSCSSVVKVIEYLPNYLEDLRDLPFGLKNRFIHLMSKRGLLSDSNLATILHSRLLNLDLSETDDVTDVGLQAIAATCRQLRKLDLNATKGNRENVTIQLSTGTLRKKPHTRNQCSYTDIVMWTKLPSKNATHV